MQIPQYLIDALYQFSEEVLAEREHFEELEKQAKADLINAEEKKGNWLTHLFSEDKKPIVKKY